MKLILFCDYGLDDAAATADALSHAAEDGYEGVDLVAIGGNVPADVALANAVKLTANCPCGVPVRIVDTTEKRQPCEYLKDIHGEDGMGNLFAACAPVVPVIPFDEWLGGVKDYDLLSLGPMTLVPQLLQKGGCRKFVFMGGNVAQVPNFHGYEFNHALDREAFAAVTKKYAHVAVTMDTCRNALLNIQETGLEGQSLICRIVRRCREMTFHSGEKGCYIWDDMAVKALRHPDWFVYEEGTDRDGNVLNVACYVLGKPYRDIVET